MQISFLGAAGTVTGSKYLVEEGDTRVLIDCGLFQGIKKLRRRNWRELPLAAKNLDGVVLTHAHLDHSGMFPRLVFQGYAGKGHCTTSTADLLGIMLPDAGRIQEEDTRYANKKGFSKHSPALPLYDEADAFRALERLEEHNFEEEFSIGELSFRFQGAGHILGASSVEVRGGGKSVLFSGDLGRFDDVLMAPPHFPRAHDCIVMESTYGDRLHPEDDVIERLAELVRPVLAKGGVVLMPAFAVGRSQSLLYCIDKMFSEYNVSKVPVFLNSPMATNVSDLYERAGDGCKHSVRELAEAFDVARFVRSVQESKDLNQSSGPMIILSASGMLTGGRILHHLKAFGGDKNNLILMPGFQASGTRGAQLMSGNPSIKIHGQYTVMKARVERLDGLSAHADQDDLLRWVGGAEKAPDKVILVHGEAQAADALRTKMESDLGLSPHIAEDGETIKV